MDITGSITSLIHPTSSFSFPHFKNWKTSPKGAYSKGWKTNDTQRLWHYFKFFKNEAFINMRKMQIYNEKILKKIVSHYSCPILWQSFSLCFSIVLYLSWHIRINGENAYIWHERKCFYWVHYYLLCLTVLHLVRYSLCLNHSLLMT